MKIINELHQLIRDNYDKIAEMHDKDGSIIVTLQPKVYRRKDNIMWFNIHYKDLYNRVTIYKEFPKRDSIESTLPFNEQLWTDFYNELKEVLNA